MAMGQVCDGSHGSWSQKMTHFNLWYIKHTTVNSECCKQTWANCRRCRTCRYVLKLHKLCLRSSYITRSICLPTRHCSSRQTQRQNVIRQTVLLLCLHKRRKVKQSVN